VLQPSCRYFRCTFEEVKLRFLRVFNCLYAKSKAANSEISTWCLHVRVLAANLVNKIYIRSIL